MTPRPRFLLHGSLSARWASLLFLEASISHATWTVQGRATIVGVLEQVTNVLIRPTALIRTISLSLYTSILSPPP
jgi:hypothetical protein